MLRGQLTTNVLLTVAEQNVFDPHWSEEVLDEARRHRPKKTSERKINRRFLYMNAAYPAAMVKGYDHLGARHARRGERPPCVGGGRSQPMLGRGHREHR